MFVDNIPHYNLYKYIMTNISDKEWAMLSDSSIIGVLGAFVKNQRLEQNKTQAQLATEAGINRDTLSSLENGVNATMLTFIQVLRALKLLHMLGKFQISRELSPIQLAKLEKAQRIRAGRAAKKISKPKSDW